jgi:hypothetical protein
LLSLTRRSLLRSLPMFLYMLCPTPGMKNIASEGAVSTARRIALSREEQQRFSENLSML